MVFAVLVGVLLVAWGTGALYFDLPVSLAWPMTVATTWVVGTIVLGIPFIALFLPEGTIGVAD